MTRTDAESISASRRREAVSLLAATTLTRLPVTAFAVLFVMQSKAVFGRYDAGGVATLCFMVGATLNSAMAGYWLGRWGQVRVAAVTATAGAVVILAAAVPNDHSVPRFCVLAGLIGLAYPPLHIASRTLYPRLLPGPALLRIYSWDVSLIQISWIVLPVSIIVLLKPVGATGLYLALAITMVLGATWYTLTMRALGIGTASVPTLGEPVRGAAAHHDPVLYVFLLSAGLVLFSSGLVLPALVAILGRDDRRSLAVLVWSVGSTVGSVLVNRPTIRRMRLTGLLAGAVLLLGTTMVVLVAHGPVLLLILLSLLLLGSATAPVTGAVIFQTSQHFTPPDQPLVFGWITGVQLIAEGLGSAISGVLLDHGEGLWVAGLIILALTMLTTLPALNLRGSFSAASPDAEPIGGGPG